MFPILPFVAGAAVGAVAALFVKKNAPNVSEKFSEKFTNVGEKFGNMRQKIKNKTADGLEKLENQSAKVRQKLKTPPKPRAKKSAKVDNAEEIQGGEE